MAHKEPSHQGLHCLPFFFFDFRLKPLFASVGKSRFKNGRVHLRNSGVKGLNLSPYFLYTCVPQVDEFMYVNMQSDDCYCNISKDLFILYS